MEHSSFAPDTHPSSSPSPRTVPSICQDSPFTTSSSEDPRMTERLDFDAGYFGSSGRPTGAIPSKCVHHQYCGDYPNAVVENCDMLMEPAAELPSRLNSSNYAYPSPGYSSAASPSLASEKLFTHYSPDSHITPSSLMSPDRDMDGNTPHHPSTPLPSGMRAGGTIFCSPTPNLMGSRSGWNGSQYTDTAEMEPYREGAYFRGPQGPVSETPAPFFSVNYHGSAYSNGENPMFSTHYQQQHEDVRDHDDDITYEASRRRSLACTPTSTAFPDPEAPGTRDANGKILTCMFAFVGCKSTCKGKNEQNRHRDKQHLVTEFWACPDCPGKEFNRSDLFTQHYIRTHSPREWRDGNFQMKSPQIKKIMKGHLQNARQSVGIVPPAALKCLIPDCKIKFEDDGTSWKKCMEHMVKHTADVLNGTETARRWEYTEEQLQYFVALEAIEPDPRGGWKLCMKNQERARINKKRIGRPQVKDEE
ncbi:hypothetical protein QQS21_005919 [Conoideocrella luteorostrata]|uniref:C2H2-type domain-containing protein n=1 Tax=Conoideocrella luteorostrata TaxID=1105319 RepID=A0AAJ0FYP4_9HYPO|nr:hypothetical protein QQS21_005919 [Conoideocrella luteorostrata]